ncbi:hypothetical protein NDU88_001846 [Pleurodeles waltl]|uniref:Uncharacterized protein n=1 Tax=Pleurodeles waltl TaxID=8319 RepID=A0AAV7WMS4_PLEWA|nr:hypothetical protein NDU88_001846 [Pleurodeles waltl]
MGKIDRLHLTFSYKRLSRPVLEPTSDQESGTQGATAVDFALLAMQQSLQSINGKIDSLNLRINRMLAITMKYRNMERVLAVIKAKNEDLKACPRRNYLCIMRVHKSTETGIMETFVETMVKEIFGIDKLSPSGSGESTLVTDGKTTTWTTPKAYHCKIAKLP